MGHVLSEEVVEDVDKSTSVTYFDSDMSEGGRKDEWSAGLLIKCTFQKHHCRLDQ